jgi:hypothetical protein
MQSPARTFDALPRNLDIADKLGCLDAEGLAEMRKGKAPTVQRGPYKGDQLSVDHIIPRAVCPELDNVIANLAFMPLAELGQECQGGGPAAGPGPEVQQGRAAG